MLHIFENRIRIVDPHTQEDVANPIQYKSPWRLADFGHDYSRLILARPDGVIGGWNLGTMELLAPAFQFGAAALGVDVSPDGTQLTVATDEGASVLWYLNPHPEDALLRLEQDLQLAKASKILLRAFSPDRKRMLARLKDETLLRVDLERLEAQPAPVPSNYRSAVDWTFAPDSQGWAIDYVTTNQAPPMMIHLWRETDGALTQRTPPPWQSSRTNGFFAGRAVVEAEAAENEYRRFMVPSERAIKQIRFSPDSGRLLAICNDGQIRTWRTSDGELDHSVMAPDSLDCADVLEDGRTLFAIDRLKDGSKRRVLFDLPTGNVTPLALGLCDVTAAVLDPAGERLLTATDERWARVWSVKTGQPLPPLVRHEGVLCWASWSPDGKRVAMAGDHPEVRVWEASTGEFVLPPLRLGNKAVNTVMWSLDGRFLAARNNENTVRVWDAATGEAVTPLLQHDGFVHVAALAANNRLVTVSEPNVLRAWDLKESKLPVDVLSDFAKLASGRTLNALGIVFPLKPEEQAELCRSLRQRAPELFR